MRYNRRSTPKVIDGQVQKKNRHRLTPNYWNTVQDLLVVDKERAGRGYKHLLSKSDIYEFIEIVPEWDRLAEGLDAILLAAGEDDCHGWYDHLGVIGICAWERDLWSVVDNYFFDQHANLFKRLGVPCERREQVYICKFTESTARAFQLLHILLHELGHHHDRMTTRSQRATVRGETYAENWSFKYEAKVWTAYLERFGLN